MQPTVEVRGDTRAQARLLRLADRLADASPAMGDIADVLREDQARQFATGSGWARLATSTVERKLRSPDPVVRANAARVMHATEATAESLAGHDSDHVEVITGDSLTFGTRAPAARYHQPDPQGRWVLRIQPATTRRATMTLQRFLLHD